MKRILLVIASCVAIISSGYSQDDYKMALFVDAGSQGFQLGVKRVAMPGLVTGISGSVDYKATEFTFWASGYYEKAFAKRSTMQVGAKLGVRWVCNNQFTATAGLAQPFVGYSYALGATSRHRLGVNVGYILGQTDYKQSDSNAFGDLEYIGTYKPKRLDIGIVYSYWF